MKNLTYEQIMAFFEQTSKQFAESRAQLAELRLQHAVKGTTMYGTVSGMIVSDEVAAYAAQQGMFVLVPNGENVQVANPKDFEPTVWALPDKK
jgi:hypothetical protein